MLISQEKAWKLFKKNWRADWVKPTTKLEVHFIDKENKEPTVIHNMEKQDLTSERLRELEAENETLTEQHEQEINTKDAKGGIKYYY